SRINYFYYFYCLLDRMQFIIRLGILTVNCCIVLFRMQINFQLDLNNIVLLVYDAHQVHRQEVCRLVYSSQRFIRQIVDQGIDRGNERSEEHTSELQSRFDLVCRLLLEKKNV